MFENLFVQDCPEGLIKNKRDQQLQVMVMNRQEAESLYLLTVPFGVSQNRAGGN